MRPAATGTSIARRRRTTTAILRTPRQAFAIGVLHGLAGTGAVVVLLIAALPSQLEAAAALAVFAPMSLISMAAFTTAFAWVLTRRPLEPVYRTVLIPVLGCSASASGSGTRESADDAGQGPLQVRVLRAEPDPPTRRALEAQLQELLFGTYLDADPGHWLVWHGGGLYGRTRYACGDHRGELKARSASTTAASGPIRGRWGRTPSRSCDAARITAQAGRPRLVLAPRWGPTV